MLIGGAAIESYGESYRTNDIDVLPERSAANLGRLASALNSLDCRLVVDPDDPGQDAPLPAGFFTARVIARQEIWNLRTRHGDLDVLAAPAGFPGGYAQLQQRAQLASTKRPTGTWACFAARRTSSPERSWMRRLSRADFMTHTVRHRARRSDAASRRHRGPPAKLKVAETLDEYRGQFAYNLLDENLRSFAARVPQVYQWNDHEVRNNWFPGQIITDPRYTETRADVLAARARQAFFEWLPIAPPARGDAQGRIYRRISYGPLLDVFVLDMRTFKDPNGPNTYADPRLGLLGPEQRAWLKSELAASSATRKVIADDLPLGLLVPDGPTRWKGVAQGDGGAPLGRELEFAEVLSSAHRGGVENIVFITADVHYTAALRYDPARAAIGDFTPFREFVSGPLNAGGFDQNPFDATFGPEAVFVKAPPANNTSPADGFQFFGHVAIDGGSRVMTVSLRDLDGKVLFSVDLEAEGKKGDKENEPKEKAKTKTERQRGRPCRA